MIHYASKTGVAAAPPGAKVTKQRQITAMGQHEEFKDKRLVSEIISSVQTL